MGLRGLGLLKGVLGALPHSARPLMDFAASNRAMLDFRPQSGSNAALILLSQVAWDDVWQRPQEHALGASAHRPVVYLSPVQIHEWRGNLGGRWQPVKYPERGRGNLMVLSPLVYPGHYKSAGIYSLNIRLISGWLGRALSRLASAGALGGVDVLLNTPLLLPAVERLEARGRMPAGVRIHYDVIDDFAGFDWAPRFSRNVDRRLIQRAVSLTTGTGELARRLAPARPDAQFIPLGVDAAAFSTPAPLPADLAGLPRPIIGYFGTLSDRLDYPLLQRVADAHPGASLVLIGPVRVAQSQLPKGPGVRVLGLRRHEDLPGYAQAFDVGLIPFRLNAANRALNPVKALEYLAAGVPVVSTDLPDVRSQHVPPVFLAESNGGDGGGGNDGRGDQPDHGAFLRALDRALALAVDPREREEYRARARTHAAGYSWAAMVRRLEAAMGVATGGG